MEVIDCNDIMVTHVRPWKGSRGWCTLRENLGEELTGVEGNFRLALYKRGSPAFYRPEKIIASKPE